MRIVILVILLIPLFTAQACAMDFSIFSPAISNTEITLQASISGTSSNYYLQGVLRSVDSSKYFGETKNNKGEWVDYLSSPEKEYILSNFFLTDVQNASWSGTLNLRFKLDDSSYKGPGNYELKLKRYTGNSTNAAGESNTLLVALSAALPSSSVSTSPSLDPSPSPSPSPTAAASPQPTPIPSPSPTLLSSKSGTVAGTTDIDLSNFGMSPSPSPSPVIQNEGLKLNQDRAKVVLMIGGGLVIISVSLLLILSRYHKTHISKL